MLQEHQLIPYRASALPAGPWLVFAPHPDDETFGMGGSLLLASRRNIVTTLVVVTNGALGGTQGMELVALREREAQEAAARLGIREVRFWRQPDRELVVTPSLIERVVDVIEHTGPASIFFPSPMELHPDHRTTSLLVWEGLRRAGFSGSACGYEISGQGPINRLVDITSVIAEKKIAMQAYQSQLCENDYMRVALALDMARTYTLPQTVTHAEGFYVYGSCDVDLAEQTRISLQPYWQPQPDQARDSSRFDGIQSRLHQPTHQLAATRERLHKTRGRLRRANGQIALLSERVNRLENSTSWRLTRPLRATTTGLRNLREAGVSVLRRLRQYGIHGYRIARTAGVGALWVRIRGKLAETEQQPPEKSG